MKVQPRGLLKQRQIDRRRDQKWGTFTDPFGWPSVRLTMNPQSSRQRNATNDWNSGSAIAGVMFTTAVLADALRSSCVAQGGKGA